MTDAPSPEHRVARGRAAERRWAVVLGLLLLVSCGQPPKPPSSEAERVMKNERLSEARHVSVSIDRPPDVVYQFAANPGNMPKWAIGLGKSFRLQADGSWIAEGGPVGSATVRFVELESGAGN